MPIGHGVVQCSCARKIFCGVNACSAVVAAHLRVMPSSISRLLICLSVKSAWSEELFSDESSNLSCGGLGPETADDTEKKLMFAAQHSGSFVSSLRLANHSVATPSIHRGRVTLNEGSLPGKGQRGCLVAEARPVSFTASQSRMSRFCALALRLPCATRFTAAAWRRGSSRGEFPKICVN